MNKEQISAEFDAFFEFPTSDKSQVSSVSCKLFSMIMVEMALSQSEPVCCPYCQGTKGHWEGCNAPSESVQVSQPVLVEISEYGEGQENDCPTCGAEFGQSCSSENGVEHGRRIHEARLAQHKPEVSPPVAETYVINKGGSGEFIAIDWKDKEGSYVGLLYSSPPDYEALKAENTLLKEVEKSFADLSENLQNDCASLKLRVAELEAATEHLGLTPQQAKDGLSRHKALVTERDRLQSDKANLIQQAEIQAQEARTMKSIVIGILTDLDLPQKDYEARSSIAQKFSRLQSECDRLAGKVSAIWMPIVKAGQVSIGDKLRFKIGDKEYRETAKEILHKGTDKEEVIYKITKNFYFITSMVISGFSNHKSVEVLEQAK